MVVESNCIPLNSVNASLNALTRHPTNAVIPACYDQNSVQPDGLLNGVPRNAIEFLHKTGEMLDKFLEYPKRFLKKLQCLNKKRGKKKQRIQAITKVCQFLMGYVELWTLKIGLFSNNGDFVSLCDIKHIAKQTGLNYIRVRRALKDLVLAGYLLVEKQCIKKEDGSFVGIASVKQFSTSFFTDLKQRYDKLVKVRNWKLGRIEKKIQKDQKKKGASFMSGLIQPFLNGKKKQLKPTPSKVSDAMVEKNKVFVAEVLKAHKEHPDTPLDHIKARLAPLLE